MRGESDDNITRSLEGQVIRLDPLTVAHVPVLTAIATAYPEVWRWQATAPPALTLEGFSSYVATALAERDAGTAMPYVVIVRATGEVIGSTRFANRVREHQRVEIGWTWIGTPWHRTGINPEMKYLMLRHAFEVWHYNRVELKTDALNVQSRGAMEKLGAFYEGMLRCHMIVGADARVRDTVYYSITAEEWPAVKLRLETRLDKSKSTTAA